METVSLAKAVTNARLQVSEIRLGKGWTHQFGSCPLPRCTVGTTLSSNGWNLLHNANHFGESGRSILDIRHVGITETL